jgi:hypothetical protein
MIVGSLVNAGVITADRDTVCELGRAKLIDNGSIGNLQWQSTAKGDTFSDVIGAKSATLSVIVNKTTQFRVIATNGICSDTSLPYVITVVPQPQAFFTYNAQGRTVNFNSGQSTGKIIRYYWDFYDGDTSDVANPVHTYAADGKYYVCLTVYDRYACSSNYCFNISLEGISGIDDEQETNLRISPNPFSDHISVSMDPYENDLTEIELYDLRGAKVYASHGKVFDGMIETGFLKEGIYFLNIQTKSGVFRKMLLKQ